VNNALDHPRLIRTKAQFSLRWLFAVTTAVAICAFVFSLTGLLETGLIAIALALVGIGTNLAWRAAGRMALAVGIIAAWFAVVDYSCFWEGCDHCRSHWFVTEVRVLHRPVWSRSYYDHSPLLRWIADDLGVPCPHKYVRWPVWRFWGCVWPQVFWSGTCCLSTDEEWYSHEVRQRVQTLGQNEPTVGREFQKALVDRNHVLLKSVIQRIHDEAIAVNPP
jgi:hypothetical protein